MSWSWLEKRSGKMSDLTNYPTAAALVMARMMKRVGSKNSDLGLLRHAKEREKQAMSSLRKAAPADYKAQYVKDPTERGTPMAAVSPRWRAGNRPGRAKRAWQQPRMGN